MRAYVVFDLLCNDGIFSSQMFVYLSYINWPFVMLKICTIIEIVFGTFCVKFHIDPTFMIRFIIKCDHFSIEMLLIYQIGISFFFI